MVGDICLYLYAAGSYLSINNLKLVYYVPKKTTSPLEGAISL